MNETTATEVMNKPIEITCYLCGKGKIVMRQGDIVAHSLHPVDHKIRHELEKHLQEEATKWLNNLTVIEKD